MYKYLIILLILTPFGLWASHNQAGEIIFEQIGNRSVKITLITYTKVSSQINRDSVLIKWGDDVEETVWIDNNYPQLIANFEDTQISKYTTTHTYGGAGNYTISFEDPYRNAGIRNIVNSAQIFLTLQTTVSISPFLGNNISPILLNPPLDKACVRRVFEHNPAAFDNNNDSLYYSLTSPKGENGEDVEGYTLPAGVSVNANTGTFTWDSPQFGGQYNFAIKIEEFRNGFKLGEIIRDMQVNVSVCNNVPPEIDVESELCVWAGNKVDFEVMATDQNENDIITLSASGGVFEPTNAPNAIFNTLSDSNVVEQNFNWQTACNHIFNSPHQIVFRAVDNNLQTTLSSFKTLNINVVAPPTHWDTIIASAFNNEIKWKENFCNNIVRYDIYRSNTNEIFNLDSCFTGMPSSTNYIKVGESTSTQFIDNSILPNNKYCYRIVAVYNSNIQSVVSDEFCVESKIILPYFTKISVTKTNELTGEIDIRWSISDSIEQLGNVNEMFYELYEIKNNIATLIYQSSQITDTAFTATNRNTKNQAYQYQVILKTNNTNLNSAIAQSPFLNAQSQNKAVQLNWNISTPWDNKLFYIYQQNLITPDEFTIIDSTNFNSIEIKNLNNTQEYCFKIESVGFYNTSTYPDSILNYSQTICVIPEDITPPCLDTFLIQSNCAQNNIEFNWFYPNDSCDNDWQRTKIYKRLPSSNLNEVIFETNDKNIQSYEYTSNSSVVGCYSIELLDTLNNSSGLLLETCVNSCASIKFPNFLSLNNDGKNDFFEPTELHQVTKIELEIYNRWGVLIYKTKELPVKWDGKYNLNNRLISAGVYYYYCKYYFDSLNGESSRIMNGFIQIND